MLTDDIYRHLDESLTRADAALTDDYPGRVAGRQPVHTVYVPADSVTVETQRSWGAAAEAALAEVDAAALADLLGIEPAIAGDVLARVRDKIAREPIEDLRIDFEDGYGQRSDAEEDAAAVTAAGVLAAMGSARPPFVGIRFKSLEPATRRRGIRTLDQFLESLLAQGRLPNGFVLTLPKVTHVDQVRAFVDICGSLESTHNIDAGALRFEVQIETPQAILAPDGSATVARLVHSGAGRISALHFGTYDYSAACGIAAPYQSLEHPAADHAKAVMQVAVAGTGIALSDGSTNIVPIGSRADIAAAWRLHARLVRRALERGYYQGWDLHPLQLVTRFAATYAFYREGMPNACERLRAYLDRVNTGVMDEPATAQALAALLVRGLDCGALDAGEVSERCGLDRANLELLHRGRAR